MITAEDPLWGVVVLLGSRFLSHTTRSYRKESSLHTLTSLTPPSIQMTYLGVHRLGDDNSRKCNLNTLRDSVADRLSKGFVLSLERKVKPFLVQSGQLENSLSTQRSPGRVASHILIRPYPEELSSIWGSQIRTRNIARK